MILSESGEIMLGSTQIDKVYLGSTQMYSSNLLDDDSAYFEGASIGDWTNVAGETVTGTVDLQLTRNCIKFTKAAADRGIRWIILDSSLITSGETYSLEYKYLSGNKNTGLSVRSGGNTSAWYSDVVISTPSLTTVTAWTDYDAGEFVAGADWAYILFDGVAASTNQTTYFDDIIVRKV